MSSRADRLKAMQSLNTKAAGKYDEQPTRNDDLNNTPEEPIKEEKKVEPAKKEVATSEAKASSESKPKEKEVTKVKPVEKKKSEPVTDRFSKKKRLSLGIPEETVEYLRIKAARTGKPMYVLVTEILDEGVVKAQKEKLYYMSPLVKKYRTRLVKPEHLAVDIAFDTSEKVLSIASELGLTATQFYNLAINEYKDADTDFVFRV